MSINPLVEDDFDVVIESDGTIRHMTEEELKMRREKKVKMAKKKVGWLDMAKLKKRGGWIWTS